MYIFIDESGVHNEFGNSAVALVYVMTDDMAHLDITIAQTEEKLKIKKFHWTESSWAIRRQFFESVMQSDFFVRVSIIQNPFSKDNFEEAIKILLLEKKFKKIIIDGKKPKWYNAKLKKLLRDAGVTVKKISTASDESYPCLRLADAYAGLVRRYWEGGDNENVTSLYKIAQGKIKTTQLVDGQAHR